MRSENLGKVIEQNMKKPKRKKEKGYLDDVPDSVVAKAFKKLKKEQTKKKNS